MIFIYFWDGGQAGDWIYACPFVSVLVMIQMLHKDTAGRKSRFLKWQLLVPSNSHCFLDTFCCLYISKNIIPSAATSRHKRMFRKCSSLDVAKKKYIYISSALATQQTQGECSENVPFMSLKTSYHHYMLHSRHIDNVHKSKRNENCYKLREQWFLPSVLPIRCRQKGTLFHCQEVCQK